MEKVFNERMEELYEKNRAAYLAMVAILNVVADEPYNIEPPAGYSRGMFKWAIRSLRLVQSDSGDYEHYIHEAVSFIRRNWLHRKEVARREAQV